MSLTHKRSNFIKRIKPVKRQTIYHDSALLKLSAFYSKLSEVMITSCNDLDSCASFEHKLALNSAPSLLGVKSASLMSLDKNELDVYTNVRSFNQKAAQKGLRIKILCECGQRCLLMLYCKPLLQRLLCEPKRRKLLENYGYDTCLSAGQCLDRLSQRCRQQNEFPHEIGIFLDYPVEDVQGFIAHKGSGFKLCGYWKVYGDEEKAKCTFRRYDKCRKYLCNKISEGQDLYKILRLS